MTKGDPAPAHQPEPVVCLYGVYDEGLAAQLEEVLSARDTMRLLMSDVALRQFDDLLLEAIQDVRHSSVLGVGGGTEGGATPGGARELRIVFQRSKRLGELVTAVGALERHFVSFFGEHAGTVSRPRVGQND